MNAQITVDCGATIKLSDDSMLSSEPSCHSCDMFIFALFYYFIYIVRVSQFHYFFGLVTLHLLHPPKNKD